MYACEEVTAGPVEKGEVYSLRSTPCRFPGTDSHFSKTLNLWEINTLPDGTWKAADKVLERRMIVECDGHDYHDRTKEQAKKDRSRDRMLQTLGYRVFRYTGSEIWSDVFQCAHEAMVPLLDEGLKDMNEAQKRLMAEIAELKKQL